MKEWPKATVFIGAAAVADYAPVNAADAKIKKEGKDTISLELKKTPDILSEVSKGRRAGQLVSCYGFAKSVCWKVVFWGITSLILSR